MVKYYVVFPRGEKDRLSIISLSDSCSHELYDYTVASRNSFNNLDEVIKYARELSVKHNLPLSSSEENIKRELLYLD